ncbi:MAG: aminotransferase class III-fold pyridoxal phosphate-dependent enzyme [Planctomyces sp.]
MSLLSSSLSICPQSGQTRESRACEERAAELEAVLETCEELIRLRIPNLLRLYLNPWVVQTCTVLAAAVGWKFPAAAEQRYPSFLANSGAEALSGAVKLARFHQHRVQQRHCGPPDSSVLFSGDELPSDFAELETAGNGTDSGSTGLIPLARCCCERKATQELAHPGFVPAAIVMSAAEVCADSPLMRHLQQYQLRGGLVIVRLRAEDLVVPADDTLQLVPDILVLDDTLTARQVPFGAFTARRTLYGPWMTGKLSTFHSTTFQPNTVSTRHLLRCLPNLAPGLYRRVQPALDLLLRDHQVLRRTFGELFSPSLLRVICAAGFVEHDVTVHGHYVSTGSRRLFDGIGGVACSLRGHNPEAWPDELRGLADGCIRSELGLRLRALTGLPRYVPAVSGAGAIEAALRMALTVQFPRTHVIIMRGGYAGKTLVALTGTERQKYRERLGPLYPHRICIDPFAVDACEQLQQAVRDFPVAAIQLELIQGVGGVRAVPAEVLASVATVSETAGVCVIVDEIQTGMHRTGPFVRTCQTPLRPEFLVLGKGTSDMLFPFALTMYSERVHERLQRLGSGLPDRMQELYGYETGYRGVLNTLRRWEQQPVQSQVETAGALYSRYLSQGLQMHPRVSEVRVFGLLIGLELNVRHTLTARLGLKPAQLYLLRMMQHRRFPLLMGYCQYEPQILKFTPPLTVTEAEIKASAEAIADALSTSQPRLLGCGLQSLLRSRR